MKYTLITQLLERDYTKANFYAKLFDDLELPHIGFMTAHPCIGNNIGIKVCLVLEAKFVPLC